MNYTIEQESPSDHREISNLTNQCFGPDWKKRTVYQFRKNTPAYSELCLVARATSESNTDKTAKDEKICGSLRYWPIILPDGQEIPLFGPLAVKPELQSKGIGKALITASHQNIEALDCPAILIIGDPNYYKDFGYSKEAISGLSLPGPVEPLTFMGREIKPNSLRRLFGPLKAKL